MLTVAVIAGGLILGLAVGRWWILGAAVAFGLWAGLTEEVEVSGWVIGIGYGAIAALGVASGVLLRRLLFGRGRRASSV